MPEQNTNRQFKRYITGHDSNGKAIVQQVDDGYWRDIQGGLASYNEVWQTSTFPVDIKNDDCSKNEKTVLSLSLRNGTVLRMVDRAPGSASAMHRTQSLDYGVVIEGEMEMILDSEETITLRRGDVCIQRGTMHQWRNSTSSWNRMLFVLIDALPVSAGDEVFTGETGYEHVKEIGSRL